MTNDDGGLLECVLAVLIRRAGGSVILTRHELDAAVEASATDGGSEWLFDYDPSPDGTEVTVRAVAAPLRARQTTGPADMAVGGVEVPSGGFPGVVLAALIHQSGGVVEVQIDSYRQMAQLGRMDEPLALRPLVGADGSDHFTVELANPSIRASPARRSRRATPPSPELTPKHGDS